jgi:2-keto-4-pentenoate hydratase/2-oxohepta-3-ene-1,7-dioic acid hydratase in catechol pathway
MTLRPGDVIATGVVLGKGEQEVFLKPGDIVEGEIPPIGVLRNHAVATA